MPHATTRSAYPLFAFAAILGLAAACLATLCYTNLEPVYRARPDPTSAQRVEDDGFPEVNWAHWRKVNRDVIGWITVPGTLVDYPVLKAKRSDPDFYLHHDIHRNWSIAGCVYLDVDCARGLTDSLNAVLYGHNMHAPGMFTELTRMTDPAWRDEHRTVLLQTPTRKCAYTVAAADVVNARDGGKRTEFASREEFDSWLDRTLGDGAARNTDRVLTLVVCSYTTWADERTVVYCTPVVRA